MFRLKNIKQIKITGKELVVQNNTFLDSPKNLTLQEYKLSQITILSSVYAIKIYELLKKQESFGQRTFFIDDLRKKLNKQSKQYTKINNFKIKVLEIAKREINSKTDLKIDFKFIKTGRKITSVQFDIESKNEKTEKLVSKKSGLMKIFEYLFKR